VLTCGAAMSLVIDGVRYAYQRAAQWGRDVNLSRKIANHIRRRSPSQITPFTSTLSTIHTACYQPTHILPTTNPPRPTSNNSPHEPNLHNSVATLAPPSPRGFVPGRLPDAGQSPCRAHHCRRPEPFTIVVIDSHYSRSEADIAPARAAPSGCAAYASSLLLATNMSCLRRC
jgi:hypothetical protein